MLAGLVAWSIAGMVACGAQADPSTMPRPGTPCVRDADCGDGMRCNDCPSDPACPDCDVCGPAECEPVG